jgi:hypothetical protein
VRTRFALLALAATLAAATCGGWTWDAHVSGFSPGDSATVSGFSDGNAHTSGFSDGN